MYGNFYNGPIPEGMVVHHKDENKAHNKIENFELKTNEEHSREHTKARMDADPELKKRFQEAGWGAAKAWHASEEGLAWHSEHGKKSWEGRTRETLVCTYCGAEYEGIASLKKKGFCSPSCQNMARIKSGVDDEERTCSICSATFKANRYAKKITCSKDCWREGIRRSWAAKRLQP